MTGVKYSSSFSVGVVMAVPAAAAALTLWGTLPPYLAIEAAYMAGKLTTFFDPGRTVCLIEKLALGEALAASPVGMADETTARLARTAVTLLKTTMMDETVRLDKKRIWRSEGLREG